MLTFFYNVEETVFCVTWQNIFGCVQPTLDEGCADPLSDVIGKRENLLENLLVLLNSAADLGVGPPIAELGPKIEDAVSVTSSARGHDNGWDVLVFLSAFY